MKQILAITRKELQGYFGSLLAAIFLGTFLAAVLFIFFSIEKFYLRGIADVRPMFQWMPILLIFLLAALTMRQWSEEQHSGTQEILLTLPTSHFTLVLGKFLAVLSMIVIALLLTLPLPVMVSFLGNLDWGPVLGGYLAAILLGAAYAAIGLFVSSRTDNQIVALIVTVLLGGFFFLLGSDSFIALFNGTIIDILRSIGTGSRFESIQRGVIDLRDLVYYVSLTAIFLTLNAISIDSIRWSRFQTKYRNRQIQTTSFILLNLILINVWLYPLQGLRLDLTSQKEFTISQTTRDLVGNLQEPLLIRAYLSEKTHPLLSPLIPQISDLLREYEIASKGLLTAEVIDPIKDPDVELEANQTYGIKPTPFQIAGRNESSIVNAYFNILVRYGDQSVILNLQDLIEVKQSSTGTDVQLKNLEYNLTAAIKKAVFGFQSVDSVLAALEQPVVFTLFVTQNLLPENEKAIVTLVNQVATEIQQKSNGKFVYQTIDPDAQGAAVTRQQLIEQYGIQPYPVSLFSQDSYFFHMILQNGDKTEIVYPPTDANEADIRTGIESSLKRSTSGFLKVIGYWAPPQTPTQDAFGQTVQPISSYNLLDQQIQQDYELVAADLSTGRIQDNIDTLVILAPQDLSETELYAIDQFLMRGGSLIIAVSPYKLDSDQFNGFLKLTPVVNNGVELLKHYGINIQNELVMDLQNAAFPVVTSRDVGGAQIQEIQSVQYPFFVDIRPDSMDSKNMIVSNLPTVSFNWASPINLDTTKNESRDTSVLLSSSPNSWLTTSTNIQPDFQAFPQTGFAIGENPQTYSLAVAIQGSFESYYKDNPQSAGSDTQAQQSPGNTITQSPPNTRLVVFASTGFVDDFALQLSSRLTQDYYVNNLLLVQNAIDWTVEDIDLLSIRSRGSATRVLVPLTDQQRTGWEIGIYIAEVILLILVYAFWRARNRKNLSLDLLTITSSTLKKEDNDD